MKLKKRKTMSSEFNIQFEVDIDSLISIMTKPLIDSIIHHLGSKGEIKGLSRNFLQEIGYYIRAVACIKTCSYILVKFNTISKTDSEIIEFFQKMMLDHEFHYPSYFDSFLTAYFSLKTKMERKYASCVIKPEITTRALLVKGIYYVDKVSELKRRQLANKKVLLEKIISQKKEKQEEEKRKYGEKYEKGRSPEEAEPESSNYNSSYKEIENKSYYDNEEDEDDKFNNCFWIDKLSFLEFKFQIRNKLRNLHDFKYIYSEDKAENASSGQHRKGGEERVMANELSSSLMLAQCIEKSGMPNRPIVYQLPLIGSQTLIEEVVRNIPKSYPRLNFVISLLAFYDLTEQQYLEPKMLKTFVKMGRQLGLQFQHSTTGELLLRVRKIVVEWENSAYRCYAQKYFELISHTNAT
ncbi:uncharacterized protein ASCRUDRAFT_138780 [Ascoidea rubescens DSM 1968]|uniref:Uncharacterized protein n=1 Tax=Ascoidea rubescens DSM 1968 TaxID=1344418 RepID=A0A1D2VJT3_9ASCO|nr:hypothetical protein ASCRUDRAFT_138780 [Ascoidea rubescens DSM 1968]ODV61876.1 hypothetical protein ASCRUDRAFT_138780 [Ascoidea rubescens DSM 1968]